MTDTWMQRARHGKCTDAELERAIDYEVQEWHTTRKSKTLPEYLAITIGMTEPDYSAWVENPTAFLASLKSTDTKHTPGPYLESPELGAIIAKNNDRDLVPAEVQYYGGQVICETVEPRNRPLLIAAPELWDFVRQTIADMQALANAADDPQTVVEMADHIAVKGDALIHKSGGRA